MKGERLVTVKFAEHCAWRATYVSVRGSQVLHFGVDPHNGVRPTFFWGLRVARGWSWGGRFALPWVRWTYPASPLRLALYRASSRFWHKVDGRYGWGSR